LLWGTAIKITFQPHHVPEDWTEVALMTIMAWALVSIDWQWVEKRPWFPTFEKWFIRFVIFVAVVAVVIAAFLIWALLSIPKS
jgi:hypothetical protein